MIQIFTEIQFSKVLSKSSSYEAISEPKYNAKCYEKMFLKTDYRLDYGLRIT